MALKFVSFYPGVTQTFFLTYGMSAKGNRNRDSARSLLVAFISATVVLIVAIAFGEIELSAQAIEAENKQRLEAMSFASVLSARLQRELNSLLFLSSGLGSYLIVRNNSIETKEINDMLAILYRNSHHVRNFGIAIGTRLTFVYPLNNNEKAIGLDYSKQPEQWPVINNIITNGKPALAGPLSLVQGGYGIIYRVPLFIEEKYWGLLSTVIDMDSFFKATFEGLNRNANEFAIRGKDGLGMQGDQIWGDIKLFSQPHIILQEIEVPGGHWSIAVKPKKDDYLSHQSIFVRILSGVIGGIMAWMLFMLIRSRSELMKMALFDRLTGLPNRNFLKNRILMDFARQQRQPDLKCALLFLDLNGFKKINDQFGHKAGDEVLRVIAKRIKSIIRLNDMVVRWGGDEFIVLIEDTSQNSLEALIQRLRNEIKLPITFEKRKFQVSASLGIANFSESHGNLDELIKLADRRMYEDKTFSKTQQ